jgi:hypothetical protein
MLHKDESALYTLQAPNVNFIYPPHQNTFQSPQQNRPETLHGTQHAGDVLPDFTGLLHRNHAWCLNEGHVISGHVTHF